MIAQLMLLCIIAAQVVTHMAPGKAVTLVTSRDRLIADKPGDIGRRAQEWLEKRGVQVGPVLILSCNQCMRYVAAAYPFRSAISSSGSGHGHWRGVREDIMSPMALAAFLNAAVTLAQLPRLCSSASCSVCTAGQELAATIPQFRHFCGIRVASFHDWPPCRCCAMRAR